MRFSKTIYDQVIGFLKSRSAERIGHVNGTLLAHLEGTCALLLNWGNPVDLCLAGLCHTVYGTDGFPVQLLDISQRSELKRMIGPQAEGLVYLFASCDRSFLFPRIASASPVLFRDRFTASIFVPEDSLFRLFLELTFANELDGARVDPCFAEHTRDFIQPLFGRCRGLVSDAAYAHFVNLYRSNRTEPCAL